MRSIFLFFSWILAITMLFNNLNVTGYDEEEMRSNRKAITNNFLKINDKIDILSEQIKILEQNSSTGNNAISQMMSAIAELNRKSDVFNNKTKQLNRKTDQLNKNIKEIMKMKELLMELIETVNEQKMHKREIKSDVIDEMTSQCTSFCEAKINTWANETSNKFTEDLEKLNFTIKNSPFKTRANACEPSPCSNGGQCELSSYRCTKCPYLTSGTHCENLNCNAANRCFQFKNSLYIVFEENISWNEAHNKCQAEGMQLAMPKDALTTEGVVNQLKTVYEPAKHNHFWIGLRSNGTKEFRWIDGTPLGDYTGGLSDFSSRQGWTILYLHGQKVYWYNMQATELYKHIHYPLCEKRISMRF